MVIAGIIFALFVFTCLALVCHFADAKMDVKTSFIVMLLAFSVYSTTRRQIEIRDLIQDLSPPTAQTSSD